MSRREKIEDMLKAEPNDVFLRYSLASEYQKEGRQAESLALLKQLTCDVPAYVPAFFRSAQFLADDGKIDEARTFLRSGIEVAREQGDLHAAGEMGEMLSDLGQLGE